MFVIISTLVIAVITFNLAREAGVRERSNQLLVYSIDYTESPSTYHFSGELFTHELTFSSRALDLQVEAGRINRLTLIKYLSQPGDQYCYITMENQNDCLTLEPAVIKLYRHDGQNNFENIADGVRIRDLGGQWFVDW